MTRRLLPDLVLSDVMMPGMDGYALCRAIKADPETDFIPVILLTARAEPSDRLAGLREQADDYLTKPFDVRELLTRIENLIAIRSRLRDRFAADPATPTLHPAPVAVEPADDKFLARLRAAIEAHLADECFNVEQLAREVAHSRGHLHRRLRQLLGETPSDLIRRMRLERAAQLLEAQAGSVAEVAYSVGFKSVAHFSNAFKDLYGVRPSGWRSDRVRRAGAPL
jgi:DNA-binding response OmpR family regulator